MTDWSSFSSLNQSACWRRSQARRTIAPNSPGVAKEIGGTCSCPASEDWGFCKHMVAAALAANAAGAEAEGAGALGRIRDHLRAKGVDALVEMLVNIAERDSALFRRLDMAATAAHDDDQTIETRLRNAIDGAIRTGDYIDYREASGWAAGVDEALDAVAELLSVAVPGSCSVSRSGRSTGWSRRREHR